MHLLKNSKWVWSGNTTITNCRQPRGTARKSRSTITRHQEDKLSKAISSLFPIKMKKSALNGTQYKDRKWGAGVESTRFTVLLVVNRIERILLLTILYCWTKAILKSLGQFKNLVFVIIPTRKIYALSLELLSPFVYRWSLICAL